MEQVVVRLARAAGKTVATAESCTGGLVASRITNVPGSSAVFRYGWVTYANEAKIERTRCARRAAGKARRRQRGSGAGHGGGRLAKKAGPISP